MPDESKLVLTNAKLSELAEGLAGLDGLRVKGELEPFLFCPETIWAISDNIEIIKTKLHAVSRAKKALAAQFKIVEGMPLNSFNPEVLAEFFSGIDALDETTVTVDGLQKISRDKLNVGHDKKKEQNTIPQTVLAKISAILED